jgi:hypothetical protein
VADEEDLTTTDTKGTTARHWDKLGLAESAVVFFVPVVVHF